MTTFMKKLFWSATAGLTMFVFLPQAKAQGRGGMRMGGRQMMMNTNMMGRMMTPNMMGRLTPFNMMNGTMMNGTMMNSNMGTPFTFPNGFGGFGNQGFGFTGNGFTGFGNGINNWWRYPGTGAYGSGYGGGGG